MSPDLVVLAAGLGSRYGGLKQLEAVGPSGEALLDYAVFDAARAGFERAVFVVRHETVAAFHAHVARFRDTLEVKLAVQHVEDAPRGADVKGRRKPWGTGHAVLTAAPHVPGALVACNADDFYGAAAYAAAAGFLRDAAPRTWGLVAYPAAETLSPAGPVNRAVCAMDGDGWLRDLEERPLTAGDAGPGELVSMNFWCFTNLVFEHLGEGFMDFAREASPDREYILPEAVRAAIAGGVARVRVLPARGRWFGLTHGGDLAGVRASLRALTDQGHYPAALWG